MVVAAAARQRRRGRRSTRSPTRSAGAAAISPRRFREHVGLPPKALARILRFERAAERLRGGADLSDAALDSGYYDQAHFNRDFKAFAGVTPTEYRVTSVQDIQSVPA